MNVELEAQQKRGKIAEKKSKKSDNAIFINLRFA
jgi:hypothetical protein